MGLIDGVIATRAGWLAKREVVEVTFDPKVIDYRDLVAKAREAQCIAPVFARSDAQMREAEAIVGKKAVRNDDAIRYEDKDTKYYLRTTPFRRLPVLEVQAVRANAVLSRGDPGKPRLDQAAKLLSPSQRELLALIRKHPEAGWPDAVGREFKAAWLAAAKVRRGLAAPKKR